MSIPAEIRTIARNAAKAELADADEYTRQMAGQVGEVVLQAIWPHIRNAALDLGVCSASVDDYVTSCELDRDEALRRLICEGLHWLWAFDAPDRWWRA